MQMNDQFDNRQGEAEAWSDFRFDDTGKNNPFDLENQPSIPSVID